MDLDDTEARDIIFESQADMEDVCSEPVGSTFRSTLHLTSSQDDSQSMDVGDMTANATVTATFADEQHQPVAGSKIVGTFELHDIAAHPTFTLSQG